MKQKKSVYEFTILPLKTQLVHIDYEE